MRTYKVLITDKVHPLLIEGLRSAGVDVSYDTSVENDRLREEIIRYHGVIINSKIIMDKDMIDRGENLLFIGRLGSGLEIIDLLYASKKKIGVFNSPEGNSNAVAEHTFGLMFSLLNNIVAADREVRNGDWKREKNRGVEIKGKTIGIIGMGHMGIAFAEKLSPWRLDVLSYDKYKKRFPASVRSVRKVGLDELCEKSDIISFHLPLTEETKWMVDKTFLNKCKDGVFLINTSRGSVVKTVDLIDALKSGKVKGAALDVFENEKPETYNAEEAKVYKQLFDMENVVLTPHIAGWTEESLRLIAEVLLAKILNFISKIA
jgi:D-3-phosphoglycerate dehydrogenase / 2-oxoglutarate reductase